MNAMNDRARYVVNTYSYCLKYSAERCLEHLLAHGFRQFELMLIPGHYWPSINDQADREKISRLLNREQARIATLNQPALDINLSSSSPEMRAYSCDQIINAMRLAGEWRAEAVVINPGKANTVFPHPATSLLDWFRASLDLLVVEARQRGVRLLVKNHPLSFLHRAEDLIRFFDDYGWDQIVIGYDVANGTFAGEDCISDLNVLQPHLGAVYAADTTVNAFEHLPVGGGEIAFAEIAECLGDMDFRGLSILEIVSQKPDEDIQISVRSLAQLGWPARTNAT